MPGNSGAEAQNNCNGFVELGLCEKCAARSGFAEGRRREGLDFGFEGLSLRAGEFVALM